MEGEGESPPLSFSDYLKQLLSVSIQAGISYSDFWDMTIAEIVLIVDSYNDRIEKEFKSKLAMNYDLAQNIAVAVTARMNGENPPSLYETYPGVFGEELKQEQEKKDALALALYKEQFIDFANRHNKRGEVNDD